MTEIAVPNTEQHVENLRQNLERVSSHASNEATSRSPRNVFISQIHHVEQATMKVAQETVNAIEATHRIPKDSSEQPFFVYHYTSIDTAIALLKSTGKDAFLRMYSSQGFNDPDEGQYLHRSTIGLKHSQDLGFLPVPNQDDEPVAKPSYAYIASFILNGTGNAAGNNIPYWMHYGDDGNGVAIKLAVPRQNLYQIKYGESNAKKTMATLRKNLEPLLEVVKSINSEDMLSTAKNIIQESLQRLNFLYKSSYYAYERECRIIELPGKTELTPQVAYEGRQSSQPFRSYLKHPALSAMGEDGIFRSGAEIILGPCVENRQDALRFFEDLKNNSGHRIQIKASSINYRRSNNR